MRELKWQVYLLVPNIGLHYLCLLQDTHYVTNYRTYLKLGESNSHVFFLGRDTCELLVIHVKNIRDNNLMGYLFSVLWTHSVLYSWIMWGFFLSSTLLSQYFDNTPVKLEKKCEVMICFFFLTKFLNVILKDVQFHCVKTRDK